MFQFNQNVSDIISEWKLTSCNSTLIVSAKVSDVDLLALLPLLSELEQQRMRRFRQSKDQGRFLLAHALKYLCLSSAMECPPNDLVFTVNKYGKPFCSHCSLDRNIWFNLSHSQDWVVLAVSNKYEVGVDVEFSRELGYSSLAQRICSNQQLALFSASGADKSLFLRFWTQKEAVCKAHGQGISVGLSSIPCSGEWGEQQIEFQSQPYSLFSIPWFNGELSYSARIAEEFGDVYSNRTLSCDAIPWRTKPQIYRVRSLDVTAGRVIGDKYIYT